MTAHPFLLCILDGVGLNPKSEGNAVKAASTPTLDRLFSEYPNATLTTFGRRVGLPEGQMGNSEVGHLNIGAGRVVKQWLVRIADAFEEKEVQTSPELQTFIDTKSPEGKIHLIGLYSFGGVHSDANHLFELTKVLIEKDPTVQIVYHLIADGRDTAPKQMMEDLSPLGEILATFPSNISIGSVHGRYYAMDRDKRWERIEKSYQALTSPGEDVGIESVKDYLSSSYDTGTTDEFLLPKSFGNTPLTQDDSVLFWNFRSDRMRQIVQVLTGDSFNEFQRALDPISQERTLCFTAYDPNFSLPILFPSETVSNHLGETLSANNVTQLRVAETEKYPHVTYFLNGGVEEPLTGEDRELVPSPKDVKTYDEKPEMSAYQVTEKVLDDISNDRHQVIILNFANCDMVGHTGDIGAATKAVEVVDECLGQILDAIKGKNGEALIIADHGNADQMIDYETGEPHTAHTMHPVPVILFSERFKNASLEQDGALCDVAPTVLKLLGIHQPEEMTGNALF